MPGLLSQMFGDGDETGTSMETQSNDATLDLSQDVALDTDVGVAAEMGGTYEELDGSTTTSSNNLDIGVGADVDGTAGAILSGGTDQASFDA